MKEKLLTIDKYNKPSIFSERVKLKSFLFAQFFHHNIELFKSMGFTSITTNWSKCFQSFLRLTILMITFLKSTQTI